MAEELSFDLLEKNYWKRRGKGVPLRRAHLLTKQDLNDAGQVTLRRLGVKHLKYPQHFKPTCLPAYGGESWSAFEAAGFVVYFDSPECWHVLKDITRGECEPLDCVE
jgi:hypothetical protein